MLASEEKAHQGNKVRLQSWHKGLSAGLLIVLVAVAAYAPSFSGRFLFDDQSGILSNPTIRSLWPIWPVITPLKGGDTVCGRPVLNLSFAINYAIGEFSAWQYHATNLAIHSLAALMLFGFLRRTFELPFLAPRFGRDALGLSLAISALWTLHPLQTESVTYLVQRAESLAGLLYLFSFYCLVRGLEGNGHKGWQWLAVLGCVIGMGCKETMVSLPVMALLYDRTFVAGTFREALCRRWTVYAPMAASWLLLAYFVMATGDRGQSTELNFNPGTLAYAQTQCHAIVKYLGLAVWPHPLVFDYGTPLWTKPMEYLPQALLLSGLAIASLVALGGHRLSGFFGCWFFAALAPSSSFVVVTTQTMAEHRMYLALVAVLALAVLAIYQWLGRKSLYLWLPIALALGCVTFVRNREYQDEFGIWNDSVKWAPNNARALANLGTLCLKAGQHQRALELIVKSIRLNPNYMEPRVDLGILLCNMGKTAEGVQQFRYAVQIDRTSVAAKENLALGLMALGRWRESLFYFEEILRRDPNNVLAKRYMDYVRAKAQASK